MNECADFVVSSWHEKLYTTGNGSHIFFLRTYFYNRVLARCMLWLISFARTNLGCKERKPKITKWKILAHTGTRTHDPWFSSLVHYPLRHPVWYTNDNLKLIQKNTGIHCAINSYIVPCERPFSFCHVFRNVVIRNGCHYAVWPIYICQTAKWHPFHITTILNTQQNKNTLSQWIRH